MTSNLLEWQEGHGFHHDGFSGEAGGIQLFELSTAYQEFEDDPPWCMTNFLPGYRHPLVPGLGVAPDGTHSPAFGSTTFGELDELKRSAEEILRAWLDRVQGTPAAPGT